MTQKPKKQNSGDILEGCGGCLSALAVLAIFLVIGSALTAWGWFILQDARASSTWSTAEGVVVSSEVTHSTDAEGDDSYSPEIAYRYVANNVTIESYTIKFGENAYSSQGKANEIAARYPVGQNVTVYYEPEDPGNSVLEPGVSGGSYIVLSVGLIFVAVALVSAPLVFIFRKNIETD